MTVLDLLTVAVLAFFGTRLFVSFRRSLARGARARSMELVRGLRLRHFLPVPVVLALVIGTAYALTSIPLLSFGWWTAIGGQGNPAFGVTDRTVGTALETVVPLVFITLLLPALPLLVLREEEIFRLGAEGWSWPKRIGKAVLFGLVHAVIGIPLGVALALSIGGMYFTLAYLRTWPATLVRSAERPLRSLRLLAGAPDAGSLQFEALLESTRAHLGYNLSIVTVVAIAYGLDAILRLTSGA